MIRAEISFKKHIVLIIFIIVFSLDVKLTFVTDVVANTVVLVGSVITIVRTVSWDASIISIRNVRHYELQYVRLLHLVFFLLLQSSDVYALQLELLSSLQVPFSSLLRFTRSVGDVTYL